MAQIISIFGSNNDKKHPLNAGGKYYVDYDVCIDHECCVVIAPDIFKIDTADFGAYVFKQPETDDELARCKEAIETCPVEAIRDDG
jgi:ferredoxin